MESTLPYERDPSWLRPGTQVGPWRVVHPSSRGGWGSVYRVERVGYPLAGPFALKLARWPQDERFEREVELLWRVRHPHVPRLQDRGWWTHPSGVSFPYVVMDWVEGLPLYEWAARRPASQRQKVEVLAQLAQALAAVHAVGGIHRDVKGGNVLVRLSDGKALLTDFGSSIFLGASRLTWEDLPPGTPGYRSPEAVLHRLRWRQSSGEPYQATPADDIYALGVTGWRLMTGFYPPLCEPVDTPGGGVDIHLPSPPPEDVERLSPELAAVLCRMLTREPSERGSASKLAEALSDAARTASPRVTPPPPARAGPASIGRRGLRRRLSRALNGHVWHVAVAACVLLALGVGWAARSITGPGLETLGLGTEDGGAAGLLDTTVGVPIQPATPPPSRAGVAKELPEEPLADQRRAPCTARHEVAIRGGCWLQLGNLKPPCSEETFEWKGACYLPSYPRGRPSTSDKP
jgi:eukaryotic-like serine/threonine-protein kinase